MLDDLHAGSGSFTVYIAVTDIDRYFNSVKDKAEVVWPLQEMAYGSREFGVRDCNGYLIAFQANTNNEMRGAIKQLVVENSDLAGSSFSDVNLEHASFQDANLRMSRFLDVNLSGAHFSNVNLSNAAIVDSNMKGFTINGLLVSQLIRAYQRIGELAQAAQHG